MTEESMRRFEEIIREPGLSSSAKLVYYLIAKECSKDGQACRKTNEQLRQGIGFKSEGRISKLIQQLMEQGYLWSERHGAGGRIIHLGSRVGERDSIKKKKDTRPKKSLCWSCANAIPSSTTGCSWSQSFQPVSGWTAIRRDIYTGEINGTESYIVQKCPYFVRG